MNNQGQRDPKWYYNQWQNIQYDLWRSFKGRRTFWEHSTAYSPKFHPVSTKITLFSVFIFIANIKLTLFIANIKLALKKYSRVAYDSPRSGRPFWALSTNVHNPSRLFPFKKKIQAKGERITVEKFARLPLIKKQALTYTLWNYFWAVSRD